MSGHSNVGNANVAGNDLRVLLVVAMDTAGADYGRRER